MWAGKPTPVSVMQPAVEEYANLTQFAKEIRNFRSGPWKLGEDETTLDSQMGVVAKRLKKVCEDYSVY